MELLIVLIALFVIVMPIVAIVAIVAIVKATRALEEVAKLSARVHRMALDREDAALRREAVTPPAPAPVVPPKPAPVVSPPPKPVPWVFVTPPAPPQPAAPPPPIAAAPPVVVIPPAPTAPPAPTVEPAKPAPVVAPPPKPVTPVAAALPPAPPKVALPPMPKPAPASESKWLDAEGLISWAKVEEIVGKRWMTWAGVLALFVAVALFAKFAFDQKWIGPGTQILAAVGAGLVLIAMGIHFLRKGLRPFGQGLVGGGIMILYAALFCAYSSTVYAEPPIRSPVLVFALMCVVTAAGMAMSVLFDALPIAFLSILGGFITPVLVSTGHNQRDGLFAYLLLLDLGVLGVAFYKKWRALDVLAFAGTCALFAGWFHKFYAVDAAYAELALVPTTLWLYAFYAVFLVLPFVHHLITRTELTIERFAMALVNATFVFGYAWRILHGPNSPALAGLSCAMAGAYLALGVLTAKRIPSDRRSLFGFIALAMSLVTIAVPVYFKFNGITLGWTAQAVAMLFLGWQFRYRPARLGAFIVLLLAIGRVFHYHWPLATHDYPFALVFNRQFLILMCAPLGAAASAIVGRVFRREETPVDGALRRICAAGAGLMFLAFFHVELGQWLTLRAGGWGVSPDYLKACSLSVTWALGAAGFLAAGWPKRPRETALATAKPFGGAGWVLGVGLVPLVVAVTHAFWVYTIHQEHYLLALNGRFAAGLIVAGVLWAWGCVPRDRARRSAALIVCGYLSLLLVNVEVYGWVTQAAPGYHWNADYMSLSPMVVLCAAGAGAFIAAGRRSGDKAVWSAGLLSLAVAAVLTVALYSVSVRSDYALAANWRFAAALAVIAAGVAYAVTSRASAGLVGGLIAAGYAALALASVESALWVDQVGPARQWDVDYVVRWSLSLVWTVGALGFLAAASVVWRRPFALSLSRGKRPAAFVAGLPALVLAFAFAASAWAQDVPGTWTLALNMRFFAGAIAVGTAFAYSLLAAAPAGRAGGCIFAGYAALVLASLESALWVDHVGPERQWAVDYTVRWSLSLVWTAGALSFLAAWWKWKSKPAFVAGLPALALAFVFAGSAWTQDVPGTWTLALNMRFLAGALAVGTAFAYSLLAAAPAARAGGCIVAGYAALILASLESALWVDHVGPAQQWAVGYIVRWSLALVWTAGALSFLAAWWKWKSKPAFTAGLLALVLAFAFAASAWTQDVPGTWTLALNMRFFAGALAVGTAFAYSLLAAAPAARAGGCIVAGYAALILASLESALWVDHVGPARQWDVNYIVRWSLALVWSAGALCYLAARWRWKSTPAFVSGLPVLGLAFFFAALGYCDARTWPYLLFCSWRFGAGLVVCAAAFAYSLTASERPTRVGGCIWSGYAVLALLSAEISWWVGGRLAALKAESDYARLWPLVLLWSAGAAAYFAMGKLRRATTAYGAALVPLAVAMAGAVWVYSADVPGTVGPLALFLNARFASAFALVAAAFLGVSLLYRDRAQMGESGNALRRFLLWLTLAGFLVLLSAEPWQVILREVKDPARAGRLAQMSLSVVWAAYAASLLAAGFWKRVRPVRFAALALFGATGIKLLFVDLSGIETLYRIISFFVFGVLLIASAYLYNKAEGWLSAVPAPAAPPPPKTDA